MANLIDYRLYNKSVDLLVQLAKRRDAMTKYWFRHEPDPNLGTPVCICNICNMHIANRVTSVREHGFQHLKEKNLLPFI